MPQNRENIQNYRWNPIKGYWQGFAAQLEREFWGRSGILLDQGPNIDLVNFIHPYFSPHDFVEVSYAESWCEPESD